jgi:integrase
MLLESLPEPFDTIVEFAIYTGFRKENILGMKIESIEFFGDEYKDNSQVSGQISLTIKGGRSEQFPFGQNAAEVLRRAIGRRLKGYVFVNPRTGTRYSKAINKTFDRYVKKLSLKAEDGSKLRFHDLRHVFGTWLHNSGASLDVIRPLMGHQRRDTTDRYVYNERLTSGKVLKLIPNIRREAENKKKASNE